MEFEPIEQLLERRAQIGPFKLLGKATPFDQEAFFPGMKSRGIDSTVNQKIGKTADACIEVLQAERKRCFELLDAIALMAAFFLHHVPQVPNVPVAETDARDIGKRYPFERFGTP